MVNKIIKLKDRMKKIDNKNSLTEKLINDPSYKLFVDLRFKLRNKNLPRKQVKRIMAKLINFLGKLPLELVLDIDIFEKTIAEVNSIKKPAFNSAQLADEIFIDIVIGLEQNMLSKGDVISLVRTIKAWHNIDLGDLES